MTSQSQSPHNLISPISLYLHHHEQIVLKANRFHSWWDWNNGRFDRRRALRIWQICKKLLLSSLFAPVRHNTEQLRQHVAIGVRSASLSKPEVLKLQERGVEVRAVELTDTPAKLDAALKGVDVVIFAATFTEVDKQQVWADAAKRAGVKRFIPNDWATPCERGVRKMYDQVRDSI